MNSTIKKQFKSHIPSCKYIFKNGKEANFIGGKFFTNEESEVAELEKEVAHSHPHIYIDENEKEVDTKFVDPMEALRAKHIKEYLAAQNAATDSSNDMGNSTEGKLNVANSSNIAQAAAGTSSGTVKLSSIKPGAR